MTNDELNAALSIDRKIQRLQARLDDLRSTGGVGGKGDNTPVQGSASVFAGQIAAELAQEIAELKGKLVIEKEIIRREINKMELSDVERKLMMLRYVECRPWHWTAASMGYSPRRVYQLHDEAKKIAVGCS